METKLTDDIRRTVRGEQAGAFSIVAVSRLEALTQQLSMFGEASA